MSQNRVAEYFNEWNKSEAAAPDRATLPNHLVTGFATLPSAILSGMNPAQIEAMRLLYERAYAEAQQQTRRSFINRIAQYFSDGGGV